MPKIPSGFKLLNRKSPFIELIGPLYIKEEQSGGIAVGILVEEKHCNSAGTVHGGLISTVADIALGNSIAYASVAEQEQIQADGNESNYARSKMVTAQLTTDFTGFARVGDWLEMSIDVQRNGGVLAFANAYLYKDDERIARSSGIYRKIE